jgi:hypothetical protein
MATEKIEIQKERIMVGNENPKEKIIERLRDIDDNRNRFTTNFRANRKYAIMTSDDYFFYGEVKSVASYDVLLVNAGFLGLSEDHIDNIGNIEKLRKLTDPRGPIAFMTIPRSKIAFSICVG